MINKINVDGNEFEVRTLEVIDHTQCNPTISAYENEDYTVARIDFDDMDYSNKYLTTRLIDLLNKSSDIMATGASDIILGFYHKPIKNFKLFVWFNLSIDNATDFEILYEKPIISRMEEQNNFRTNSYEFETYDTKKLEGDYFICLETSNGDLTRGLLIEIDEIGIMKVTKFSDGLM